LLGARILGLGLCGPGLNGWVAGSDVLRGVTSFTYKTTEIPLLDSISPREQRRLSPIVRLALAVAEEAVAQAAIDPKDMSAVFGWPHGNNWVLQNMFEALSTEDRLISPTEFHNAVHNVAVGYWSIHAGCQRPCTSISAEIHTFAASLIKSFVQIEAGGGPVLLTVTDAPFREPLNAVCPIGEPFAAAMVLAPDTRDIGFASIEIELKNGTIESCELPKIEAFHELWNINAAARALPFLECLATRCDGRTFLPYGPFGGIEMKLGY
jgi:hypothetical protein